MNSTPATRPSVPLNSAPVRVLVADDDPVSSRFLGDGLASLGAQVVVCKDGLQALACARVETFDLLLLDCRMPGAGALQTLRTLRGDSAAASGESLAVATTAELETGERQTLLAAGFFDILRKPCELGDLRRVLALLPGGWTGTPVLDDDAGLTSSGDATTMRALRLLLREELAALLQQLHALGQDPASLDDRMHRLRSSCGFCGAPQLASEAARLQAELTKGAATADSMARLHQVVLSTLRALDH